LFGGKKIFQLDYGGQYLNQRELILKLPKAVCSGGAGKKRGVGKMNARHAFVLSPILATTKKSLKTKRKLER